jgi:hypothetical protein
MPRSFHGQSYSALNRNISQRDIAGIWETYEDALQAGYERFGLKPFLVKKIESIEGIQRFTRDMWTP